VHPYQTERFEVLSGTLGVKAGGARQELAAGDSVVIEPGTPHMFWNAGDDTLCFRAEVRPALQFESLIETMFGLATDGKTNRKGMPNPLQLAVIARHHFDVVRLAGVPGWMQKAGLAMRADRAPARLSADVRARAGRPRPRVASRPHLGPAPDISPTAPARHRL